MLGLAVRRTVFRRRETPIDRELLPGEYRQCGPGSWGHVVVRCPNCKRTSVISKRNHVVDPFGFVDPKSMCPWNDCSWSECVALDEWHPPAVGTS